MDEKFLKAADEKAAASSSFPPWSEVYWLGNLDKFHEAPHVNEGFSRLLSKPVSLSWYVSMSLDNTAKLEACVRGQIESQSFSPWALASVFEFLRESDCVPDSPVFHQLISSMTKAINAQASASFSAAAFLKQIHWETLVSHLPLTMYASVKHALLSSLSTSSLFSEDVVKASLTQVKEDSQLSLLSNISSKKDGKRTASSSSSSSRGQSSLSAASRGSSYFSRSMKHPVFSSPNRRRVTFYSKAPSVSKSKEVKFSEIELLFLAHPSRWLSIPPLVHLEGQGSGSVSGGGVAMGVSDPLLFPSSSLSRSGSLRQLFPVLHQGKSFFRGSSLSHRQRSG